MIQCVLCGNKIDKSLEKYSYDKFLHECDKDGCVYCRNCREILRCTRATDFPKNSVKKVKIQYSHYPLQGFMLAHDGKQYIRIKRGKKKKGYKRGMNIGRFL
jgi:hypothetical protein